MRKPTKAILGAWLKRAREAARDRAEPEKRGEYAQAGVAERLGVRERAVRMWEKGRTSPPTHQFLELVEFYDANVLEIVPHKDIQPPTEAELSALDRELDAIIAASAKKARQGEGRQSGGG